MNKLPGTGDFMPPDEPEPTSEDWDRWQENRDFLNKLRTMADEFEKEVGWASRTLVGIDARDIEVDLRDFYAALTRAEKENEDLI